MTHNPITSLATASPFRLHSGGQWRGASEFHRWAEFIGL